MNQVKITQDQIEIRAPLYCGLIFTVKILFIYLTIACILFDLMIALSDLKEKIELIIIINGSIYFVLLSYFAVIKIYYKISRTIIIINMQEIALYRKNFKKKWIRKEDISKINFYSHASYAFFMDEYAVYSYNKKRIRFYAAEDIMQDIRQLVNHQISIYGKNTN
ncbi:MAG: hypothetical protein J1F36_05840 [Clostridiales bacterium]|nr:hypothetical protein [Clostridiales bacterium]